MVPAVPAAAELLLAAGALYDTLLAALRLDLATAVPVARANRRLLAVLSPPLLSSVRQYCKAIAEAEGAVGGIEIMLQLSTARLAMLLRVYGAVVHRNAVCSGIHPEIPPLPGQDIVPQHQHQVSLTS